MVICKLVRDVGGRLLKKKYFFVVISHGTGKDSASAAEHLDFSQITQHCH